uniref:Uncharacterized protein n=1 Tax=Pristionchus pacificus TaxID=54126 RepID=A0A2A6CGH2_PRIPA|eukprot:PDM77314.1 hypothetical protein PRIPAC_38495 [Pristionchus pacificus]
MWIQGSKGWGGGRSGGGWEGLNSHGVTTTDFGDTTREWMEEGVVLLLSCAPAAPSSSLPLFSRPISTEAPRISRKGTEDLKRHRGSQAWHRESTRSSLRIATLGRPISTLAPRISTKGIEDLHEPL